MREVRERMAAFMREDEAELFDVDSDRFAKSLTVSVEENSSDKDNLMPFLAVSGSSESITLHLSHVHKHSPRLSTKGILSLMNHCDSIRELSLSYALLTDELLRALSNDRKLHLDTLRVEAHPEEKPITGVKPETWLDFTNHLPGVNLVLLAHLTEAKDYDELLSTHVPVTHLCLGDGAPSAAVTRVGEHCPRLAELVVSAYGPGTIDEILIVAARGCPRLNAVGLGDCELTCSGLIEFVSLCSERLKIFYVLDTSLLEDSKYEVAEATVKVSTILGRPWQPNYVPYW